MHVLYIYDLMCRNINNMGKFKKYLKYSDLRLVYFSVRLYDYFSNSGSFKPYITTLN
jgi:hypothetical protein